MLEALNWIPCTQWPGPPRRMATYDDGVPQLDWLME
jgi:hypothetical protein